MRQPDRLPGPHGDEVHLWWALLPEARHELAALESTLSDSEKQKVGRLLRPDDRARGVMAHGILRQLLGRYLGVAPGTLRFVANEFGKPAIDAPAGAPSLAFNLAHSGAVVCFAFAGDRQVGVDVEEVRTNFDVMELAAGQFSPREVATLEAFPADERTGAFFRCWTRKEAFLKARGQGLSYPLQQFAVAFGRNEAPAMQWAADDPAVAARWAMFDFTPAPNHAGALVVEGGTMRPVLRQWPETAGR